MRMRMRNKNTIQCSTTTKYIRDMHTYKVKNPLKDAASVITRGAIVTKNIRQRPIGAHGRHETIDPIVCIKVASQLRRDPPQFHGLVARIELEELIRLIRLVLQILKTGTVPPIGTQDVVLVIGRVKDDDGVGPTVVSGGFFGVGCDLRTPEAAEEDLTRH